MKSNIELFAETWKLLKGKWLWRVMAVSLIMSLILQFVSGLLHLAYKLMGVTTVNDLVQDALMASARRGQLQMPPPSAYRDVMIAYGFELFVSLIFGAIVAWGIANAALKATRNDDRSWFAGAFAGFKNPLGFAWLQLVLNVRIFLWFVPYLLVSGILLFQTGDVRHYFHCLPLALLGVVAIYRYRLVWYLKNDLPELTASQCMAESARRMVGYKWKCFCFGLIYFGIFLALVLAVSLIMLVLMLVGGKVLGALLALPLVFAMFFFFIFWLVHLIVSHAVFYRNLPPRTVANAI